MPNDAILQNKFDELAALFENNHLFPSFDDSFSEYKQVETKLVYDTVVPKEFRHAELERSTHRDTADDQYRECSVFGSIRYD